MEPGDDRRPGAVPPPAGGRTRVTLAWGSVAGSALQFGVQLPVVLRLARGLRASLDTRAPQVREVLRNFGPVFFSRGVVQISGWVDSLLASLLGTGAVAGLTNAADAVPAAGQLVRYVGIAAELPAMSSALGGRTKWPLTCAGAWIPASPDRIFRRSFAMAFWRSAASSPPCYFNPAASPPPNSRYVWPSWPAPR